MDTLQGLLIMVFFGLLFCGPGVWMLLGQKRLEKICTARASGVVQDISRRVSTNENEKGDIETSVTYAPTFRYVVDGTEYIQTPNTSSSRVKLKAGDAVTVFYDPGNPNKYYVSEYRDASILGIVLVIAGASVIVLGIYQAVTGG